ncbi:MAG: tetratricopeptide repeat protein [Candidatus Hodarchaeales archaeon]
MESAALKKLFEEGKYKEIVETLDNMGSPSSLTFDELIDAIYYRSRSMERLGKFNEALEIIEKARRNVTDKIEGINDIKLIIAQLYAQWRLGHLDDAAKVSSAASDIIKSLTESEFMNGAFWIGSFFNIKGIISRNMGELDSALHYYKRSLSLHEEHGSLYDVAISLNNIGVVLSLKGEIDAALDYYKRSRAIWEEIGDPLVIATSLNNIGEMYRQKGELDTALNYYERSRKLWESIGNPIYIAASLNNTGRIYRGKGQSDIALKCFQESLSLLEKSSNDIEISDVILSLVIIYLDKKDIEKAREHSSRLKSLYDRTPEKIIKIRSILAESLLLKQSNRMRDKAKAQELLDTVINNADPIDFELEALAMIASCELLLYELKSSEEPAVLDEVREVMGNLYMFVQNQHSFVLAVRVLLLRFKFAVVEGRFREAQNYLDQAWMTAEEKNIGLLSQIIAKEKVKFGEELEKWQELARKNVSVQERFKKAQIDNYLNEISRVIGTVKP